MWQRWNSGTKIFEKSSDNGTSWTPLGLDASIITQGVMDPARLPPYPPVVTIPPNIAFTNVVNTFLALQQHLKSTTINYAFWSSEDNTGKIWGAGPVSGDYQVRDLNLDTPRLILNKTTGGLTLTGNVFAPGGYSSIQGAAAAPHGTATTLFTFPSGSLGAYLIYFFIVSSDTANYAGMTSVFIDGPSAKIIPFVAASLITTSISGLSFQVVQQSGVTQTVQARAIRIL